MVVDTVTPPVQQRRFPMMEAPAVGFVLAFISGTMDAWTWAKAETFATVQSGNIIKSGSVLAEGNWGQLRFPLVSIVCFGVGSLVAGWFMTALVRRAKSFAAGILFAEAAGVVVLAVLVLTVDIDPRNVAFVVSFIAGAQGNAFHKDHGMLYGNVAVTAVVQMAFNFVVQSRFSKKGIDGEPNLMWAGIFFGVVIAFGSGAAAGTLATDAWNGGALFVPATLLVVLGLFAFDRSRRHIDPDPTPGGLIP